MPFGNWVRYLRSRLQQSAVQFVIIALYGPRHFTPRILKAAHSLSLNTKRLIIIVLCISISGVFSAFNFNPPEASADPLQNEYWISIGPINGTTTAPYSYASVFNPSSSGKTLVAKRIRFNSDAVAAATLQDLNISRTTAASGGTLIDAADIPRKNTDNVNPVAEVRHTGVSTTLVGTTANRPIMAVIAASAAGNANGGKDYTFNNNQLVLQPGEGIALHQTAAGDADQRIRLAVEWEEVATTPTTNDFMLAFPRVSIAAAADGKYHTLFNPAVSGKTAVISRLNIDVDCDAAAVYNPIYVRRISAVGAGTGTTIAPANIPKKHSSGATSVMDARYSATGTLVTATGSGATTSSIAMVTPCGAVTQPHGHQEFTFGGTTEELVLQPGEGIALIALGAGDVNQLVRLSAVWSEQASAPTSQGQYVINNSVTGNTTSNFNHSVFYNPAASGKTAVIKKLGLRVNATGTSVAIPMNVQRISAYTGGTAGAAAANIPKKHSGSANSVMAIINAPATVTLSGATAGRILSVTTPAAVGQLQGQMTKDMSDDSPLVLQPGQGIVVSQEGTGSTAMRIILDVDWDEEITAPASSDAYMYSTPAITGNVAASYYYLSMMNPSGSGKTMKLERLGIRIEALAAATYVPISIKRITAVTSGTAITTDIPKKHTGASTSVASILTAPTGLTIIGSLDGEIIASTTPGAAATAAAPQVSGNTELEFNDVEPIILQPGEGLLLHQEAAGDADHRIRMFAEWSEDASTPAAQEEYIVSTGPMNGSTAADYVYSSLYNPRGSGKNFVVKRIEIRADRIGTGGYLSASVRRITSISGSNLATASIIKKHSNSSDSAAQIATSTTSSSVTYASSNTSSRLMGVTTPGLVGQDSGLSEAQIISGDELVLAPGEGIALQHEGIGDANIRYRLRMVWSEETRPVTTYTQSAYRWYNNDDSLTPGSSLAAENTPAAAESFGDDLRLRMGLTPGTYGMYPEDQDFKLQHATSTSGPWTDVNNIDPYPSDKITSVTASGTTQDTALSPDGTYMAVGLSVSPYLSIYKRSGSTFNILVAPDIAPTSTARSVDFSTDGNYLAVAHNTTPFIDIYKRNGDTFTKLTSPAALAGTPRSVSWSSDDTYLSVGHSTTPFVSIYKKSGDTFTKLANPSPLPTGQVNAVDFTPNGDYMTIGGLKTYKRSGDTFTGITDPATMPLGTILSVDWSDDGIYLSVTTTTIPGSLNVYKRSGDTLTKLPDAAVMPAGTNYGAEWSKNGTYLTVAHSTSPYITQYKRIGDAFQMLTTLSNPPTAATGNVSYSADGKYLATSPVTGSQIGIYATQADSAWKYQDNTTPTDRSPVPTAVLSGSPKLQTYNESSPTALNPTTTAIGERAEWDFALDSSSASAGTYYFRMVKSDGTALDVYSQYPQITIPPPPSYNQSAYRWYNNSNTIQPGAPKANENSPASLATPGDIVRLRSSLTVGAANLAAGKQAFKLQYSISTGGPWTDVANPGMPTTKLGNPSPLFTGNAFHASWSPDSTYVTVNYNTTSPYFSIYKRSGDTFSKLADPSTLPTGTNSSSSSWSPDGTYMTVGSNASPYIFIYKRSGDTFTKLANPATLPQGTVSGANWSPDGMYLSVIGVGSPYVNIYKRSGDTFTKLANPADLPPFTGSETSWSPDGNYLSVTYGQSPGLVIYKRSGDTFTKLADPAVLPNSASEGTQWSPDGTYLTVTHSVSPYVTIYKQSEDTFTKLADPAELPAGGGKDTSWSPDGVYMVVSHLNAPYITSYKRTGDTFIKQPPLATPPTGTAEGVAFSSDGTYMAVAHFNSPFLSLYKSVPGAGWAYKNNLAPADKSTISSALLSGSPSLQSYTESSPTAINPNMITNGQKGEWDFSLDSAGATNGTYYFRMTESDGTVLNTYSQYPQISVGATNTAPDTPATLAQTDVNGSITTGGWNSSGIVTFGAQVTDPDAADMLQLCVEVQPIGTPFTNTEDECGTATSYTGLQMALSVDHSMVEGEGQYHWQARVKDAGGLYSSWLSYGANAETVRDFGFDETAPVMISVFDGTTAGADIDFNNGSLDTLSANWSAVTDSLSGLKDYTWVLYEDYNGPGMSAITNGTVANNVTSVTVNGLTLRTNRMYSFHITARDNANNTAPELTEGIDVTDGQFVAPSVSFSVSPSTINMSNLNAGNGYTDTKTTTLTTSTNAYGGYVVRSFVTDLLRSTSNQTIGNFNGGSYAAPDAWRSGDIGFGYTSNDASVQSVSNKFGANGCAVTGLPTTCLFAPFATSGPGDIVADHTAAVSGTPVTNQQFTVTYRATSVSTQPATKYNTNVVYTITPVY